MRKKIKSGIAKLLVLCMMIALVPNSLSVARAEDTSFTNLMTSATVTTNATATQNLAKVADGDINSGTWRPGTDIAEDYIQFNWTEAITVNKLVMTVTKARNCAPTAWSVEVSKDGESDWTEVASVSNITWNELGDVKETSEVKFEKQDGIKGIRVHVKAANLTWSGYTIQEIEAFYESNHMLSATVTANVPDSSSLAKVADGSTDTGFWRAGTDISADYIQFNWDEAVSVNKLVMTVSKARNCAPTSWSVEVSKDGENDWTEVASVSDIEWLELGNVIEKSELTFKKQNDIKGVRVHIKAAHLTWSGYTILELASYDDPDVLDPKPELPEDGNYIVISDITTNADTMASLDKIQDGDVNTGLWRPGTDIAEDYIQFNWEEAITVNKLVMTVTKARNSAPTDWKIQVSKDGQTEWTEVASISDIAWLELGDVKETSELTFKKQEDIKGIRVYIEAANLTWTGYAINEIAAYNDPNVVDPTPEVPESKPELPADGNYIAIADNVATNAERLDRLEAIKDCDPDTGLWRYGTDIGKDYIQFNWEEAITVNKLVMTVTKARNCAPTSWSVQVSKDGENDWTEVASVSSVKWAEAGDVKETSELIFKKQEDIKGIRVYIEAANLEWNGYAFNELAAYNDPNVVEPEPRPDVPVNGNYATIADITTNAGRMDRINSLADGDNDYGMWRPGEAADIEGKDYIQFNWDKPVTVSQVIMIVTKARNDAPTAWRVQVSKDGENDWTEVASVKDIKWLQLGNVKENSKLSFGEQKDIKGLRIYIDKANMTWGGYGIQEIEIYNQYIPNKGEDMPLFVPLMVMMSLAGVALCAYGYSKKRSYIAES